MQRLMFSFDVGWNPTVIAFFHENKTKMVKWLYVVILVLFVQCSKPEQIVLLKQNIQKVKIDSTEIILNEFKYYISNRESRLKLYVVRNNTYFGTYQIHKMYLENIDKGLFLTNIEMQDSVLIELFKHSIQELEKRNIPTTMKNIDLCHRWGINGAIKRIKN